MTKINPALLSRCVADVFVNEEIKKIIEPITKELRFTIKQIIALIEKEDQKLFFIKIILDFTDLNGSNHDVPNVLITYSWNKQTKVISYIDTNSKTSPLRSVSIGQFVND